MREFMILMGELLFIAVFQMISTTFLDEVGQKWIIKLINVACIVICYFLMLRYVYNQLLEIFSIMT